MSEHLQVWQLKPKADKRIRSGHPWVFSNEIQFPKKTATPFIPGSLIELKTAQGDSMGIGFGNLNSLIAWRRLGFGSAPYHKKEFSIANALELLLSKALEYRQSLGLTEYSYRLFFAEADGFPGLIIDSYFESNRSQRVLVIQAHTAGVDLVLEQLISELKKLFPGNLEIIIRKDIAIRKLEGVPVLEEPEIRGGKAESLKNAQIRVRSPCSKGHVDFNVDLVDGQKTGFFLDQVQNVELFLRQLTKSSNDKSLKAIDLCCYVGQWSTQLSAVRSGKLDLTLVDISQSALDKAEKNVKQNKNSGLDLTVQTLKSDVLKNLDGLPDRCFDLIFCDPPALIQNRKSIPQGEHAYLQVNTSVFRLVKKGGYVVSCSCSSLLEENAFLQALNKAARRNNRVVRWFSRGFQSPDHPVLTEFPEGQYLKCWIGRVEN
jgi:23S rRNA (cytosine1962-C5)-methyltransferase